MLEAARREDERDASTYRPVVAIGHTKDLLDLGVVERLLEDPYLHDIEVSTFEGVRRRCSEAGPKEVASVKVVQVDIDWNPQLSIFASERYLRHLGPEHGWLGGVDDAGDLACVLPDVVVRKPLLRVVRFTVETIPLKPDFDLDRERRFLNAVVVLLGSMKVDVIIPATFSSPSRPARTARSGPPTATSSSISREAKKRSGRGSTTSTATSSATPSRAA